MVILGLGSNVGDRKAYLRAATGQLKALMPDLRLSRLYESAALLPPGAPPEWDVPFFNMAAAGTTNLEPAELLAEAKRIEREVGRIERAFWGPREIDIDILAMDDAVVDTPSLAIPHRELLKRDFALLPLAELAPDWRYPAEGEYHGRTAAEIVKEKRFTLKNAGHLE